MDPILYISLFIYLFLNKSSYSQIIYMENPQQVPAQNQELCKIVTSLQNTDNVTQLELKNKSINAQGIIFLTQFRWENLSELDLKVNRIGDSGVKYLSKMELKNLEKLYLVETNLSDPGIRHLSKARLPKLKELYLGDNRWGNGIQQLTKAHWPELNWISFAPVNNDKISKMTFFDAQNLMKGDWKNLKIIIIPEFHFKQNFDQENMKKKYIEIIGVVKTSVKFL